MRIIEWIESGEVAQVSTTEELLSVAGGFLDAACSHDILGPVLFRADDGKHYVLSVEAIIQEADPKYVQDRKDAVAD